ncbi:hypothetical protein HZ326_31896 [Fusarium oxysporum f. sp. albedinis]|nr:hypothetical protein HZ326_31896 [Fusarium oxysporum f. sp. albedinis]
MPMRASKRNSRALPLPMCKMDGTAQGDDASMCKGKARQPLLSFGGQSCIRRTKVDTEHGSSTSHNPLRDRHRSPGTEMTTTSLLTYRP